MNFLAVSTACHGGEADPGGREKQPEQTGVPLLSSLRYAFVCMPGTVLQKQQDARGFPLASWDILVCPAGIEPAAYSLGGYRSIRLSYEHKTKHFSLYAEQGQEECGGIPGQSHEGQEAGAA